MRKVSWIPIAVACAAVLALGGCGDTPKPAATAPVQTPTSDADVKLLIGLQLRDAGRFQEALGLFEQILAADPSNEKAQFNRATSFADLGRTAEAMAEFDRLAQLHPDDPDIVSNRAVVLMQLDRNEEALAACDKALAISPGRIPTRMLRAQVLSRLARYDDALKELDVAKGQQPSAVQIDLGRADVMRMRGDGAAAEAIYAELTARFPNEPRLTAEIDARRKAAK